MLFKTVSLCIFMMFLTTISMNIAVSSASPVSASALADIDANDIEALKAHAATIFDSPSAQGWRRCETSDASPHIIDIYWAVITLQGQGGTCCNTAIRMNECTNIIAIATADIGFCGVQRCIPCLDLAKNVWLLANECGWNGKAGGVSFLDETSYIVTY